MAEYPWVAEELAQLDSSQQIENEKNELPLSLPKYSPSKFPVDCQYLEPCHKSSVGNQNRGIPDEILISPGTFQYSYAKKKSNKYSVPANKANTEKHLKRSNDVDSLHTCCNHSKNKKFLTFLQRPTHAGLDSYSSHTISEEAVSYQGVSPTHLNLNTSSKPRSEQSQQPLQQHGQRNFHEAKTAWAPAYANTSVVDENGNFIQAEGRTKPQGFQPDLSSNQDCNIPKKFKPDYECEDNIRKTLEAFQHSQNHSFIKGRAENFIVSYCTNQKPKRKRKLPLYECYTVDDEQKPVRVTVGLQFQHDSGRSAVRNPCCDPCSTCPTCCPDPCCNICPCGCQRSCTLPPSSSNPSYPKHKSRKPSKTKHPSSSKRLSPPPRIITHKPPPAPRSVKPAPPIKTVSEPPTRPARPNIPQEMIRLPSPDISEPEIVTDWPPVEEVYVPNNLSPESDDPDNPGPDSPPGSDSSTPKGNESPSHEPEIAAPEPDPEDVRSPEHDLEDERSPEPDPLHAHSPRPSPAFSSHTPSPGQVSRPPSIPHSPPYLKQTPPPSLSPPSSLDPEPVHPEDDPPEDFSTEAPPGDIFPPDSPSEHSASETPEWSPSTSQSNSTPPAKFPSRMPSPIIELPIQSPPKPRKNIPRPPTPVEAPPNPLIEVPELPQPKPPINRSRKPRPSKAQKTCQASSRCPSPKPTPSNCETSDKPCIPPKSVRCQTPPNCAQRLYSDVNGNRIRFTPTRGDLTSPSRYLLFDPRKPKPSASKCLSDTDYSVSSGRTTRYCVKPPPVYANSSGQQREHVQQHPSGTFESSLRQSAPPCCPNAQCFALPCQAPANDIPPYGTQNCLPKYPLGALTTNPGPVGPSGQPAKPVAYLIQPYNNFQPSAAISGFPTPIQLPLKHPVVFPLPPFVPPHPACGCSMMNGIPALVIPATPAPANNNANQRYKRMDSCPSERRQAAPKECKGSNRVMKEEGSVRTPFGARRWYGNTDRTARGYQKESRLDFVTTKGCTS